MVFGGRPRQEGHEHDQSSGSESRDALACTPRLYKNIVSATKLQRKWDERGIKLLATIDSESEMPARGANIPEEEVTNEILEAWDDASGEDLDPDTVLAARREEIAHYKAMGAFTKVPISQCIARTGRKPIGVRWRDINKGDRYNVNVRSRLVAKEFNNKKCDDLFAGTPPVEAMRAIISMAASGATPKTLMTVDVSRAYMYAKCRNEMYVELCPEAYEEDDDEKCCWRLEKAMYGTRSAAQDWQHEIKRRMSSIGYVQGKSNPCLFYNPSSEVACLVHGDDFLAAGGEISIETVQGTVGKGMENKTHTHIGEAEHDCRGSGPRKSCLSSSTAIRRQTSTSGLRQWLLPLPSTMRKWRTFFTDADPTSHRVRLWRGGSASSLFFYLFFYSFVEYVDIDTSTYSKAPGPYCGAEGRWRIFQPLSEGSCVVSLFPVVYNVSPLSFNN